MNPLLLAGYIALCSGNTADVVTTQQAFSRGAIETQGLATVGTQDITKIAVSRVVTSVAIGFVMHKLSEHGHNKIAASIGFFDGGMTFAASLHNVNVRR